MSRTIAWTLSIYLCVARAYAGRKGSFEGAKGMQLEVLLIEGLIACRYLQLTVEESWVVEK
jgi:hypothetical protein